MSGVTESLPKATQFLKTCTKCREQKWDSEFSKDKNYSDGFKTWCKDCRNNHQQMCRQNNPKYTRINLLKSKYGITIEDYEMMLKSQNGVCVICGQPETQKDKNSKIQPLSVDHCHKPFKIRGLLCCKCNNMLSNARDNIEILKRAIKYLEK